MSTVNIGSSLPAGSSILGQIKLVDTGGTNQAAIDANNNLHVALYNAANSMAIDSSNNAHVGVWNGSNQLAVNSGGNAAANIVQVGSNAIATGTGASGSGIMRVTVANDSQIQQWDGTHGPVAVKAAGTSPVLADIAAVQVLSPNNTGLPVNLPSQVQKAAGKSSGSVASLALAFGSNNAAGNSIIVACGVGNGTAPTVTDSNSNTYTQSPQVSNGSALNVAIFYAVNIAAGANTVTVNNGGTTASIAMEIYEVSGLLTQVPNQPDQTATNSGNSGTASTSAISALTPNELAFAAIGVGTAAQTITVGSGWTNDSGQQNPTTPAGLFSFIAMSQALGSLKAVTPQATFTSEPWAIAVATFRPVLVGVEGTSRITDGTVTMTFGQNTMANSMPVVLPSNQSALPVSESGTWTVQPGNTPNTSAWLVQNVAGSSNGSVPYHNISAASTNFTNVKGAAAQMYSFRLSNTSTSAIFVKFFDKATTPATTDTPKSTIQVPANGTVLGAFPEGMKFTSGFGWAATGAVADNDNTNIAANCVIDFSLNS